MAAFSTSDGGSGEFTPVEERSGVRQRPKRARRRSVPSWLTQQDENDLRTFWRNGGSSATTRSTTAACLAIIAQRSRVAIPCERCGGSVARGRAGTGFCDSSKPWPRPKNQKPLTENEKALLGLLDLAQVDAEQELIEQGLEPPLGDMLCPTCDGRGWIVGGGKPPKKPKALFPPPPASPFRVSRPAQDGLPNVWPTNAQEPPSGYEMTAQLHTDLQLLGRMSHRTRVVLEGDRGALAVEALGAFFAPDGGTIAALWHLTAAGKKMLRTNPLNLHHRELFANLREQQALKPDANRGELFVTADKQALALFQWACEQWNAAGPPKVDAARAHDEAIDAALSWGEAALNVLRKTVETGATFLLPADEKVEVLEVG